MGEQTAEVRFGRRLAGRLSRTARGYVFQYDPAYLRGGRAISASMPLRAEPYATRDLPPFFEGLLPEGWYLEIASRTLKVDPRDKFGLLLATCRDCVGAVSVRPAA